MKHLDPSLLASLADGAPESAAARAHLRACEDCRTELAELRALTGLLAEAPAPSEALRRSTLQKLGLRPRRERGGWQWAWAPLALAGFAGALIWQRHSTAPSASPVVASAPSVAADVPHRERAPRSAAEAREQEHPTLARSGPAAPEALIEGAAQAQAPAVGLAPQAPEEAPVKLRPSEPKPQPTPGGGIRVGVRNNLIHPGESLALTIDLPQAGDLLVRVLDGRGRPVETLYQGPAGTGSVILHWAAQDAPSGAYSVLIRSGSQSQTVRALVVR